MSAVATDRRREMLSKWKRSVQDRGHPVPADDQLSVIAESNLVPVADSAVEIEPWRTTIEWLLNQMRLGVFDPVSQLPEELKEPALRAPSDDPAPISVVPSTDAVDSPAEVQPDTPIDALRAWRRAGIESGRAELSSLKESALIPIARMKNASADGIAPKLPQSLRVLADEIATIMSGFAADDEAAPSTAASDGADAARVAAPAPAAAVTPVATRPEALADAAASGGLTAESFADFDFTTSPEALHAIKIRAVGDGSQAAWPKHPDAESWTVVYRLVYSDDYPPYAPDRAHLIAATQETKAAFTQPFTSAVRHLQVWANTGTDVDDAVASQPVLFATTSVVCPVADIDIREDEGRVIGQWDVFDGVTSVQIHRIPVEKAAFGGDDPQYRIHANEPNLGGFVDATAERGKRYLYRVRAEAEVDGTTVLSTPTQVEVGVSAVLEAVEDLAVVPADDVDDPTFDLTWTAPQGGKVVIYRTTIGPNAGAESETIPEGSLALAGLPPETKLAHPVVAGTAGGSSAMRNVPWPRDWNRAYFTAVTLLAGQAQIGRTVSATRIVAVSHAQLIERVNKQILTFEWPSGAASVLVHVTPRGAAADDGITGHPIEVTAGMYERLGGLHFASPLPSGGCALHLVPVAFAAGQRVLGSPVTVDYPGLLRAFYNIDTEVKRGRPADGIISIAAEMDLETSPPFVLVHNSERLPLSAHDGNALPVTPASSPGAPPVRQFTPARLTKRTDVNQYRVGLEGLTGFIRLFAALPANRLATLALLDPPMAKLMLGPGAPR